MVAGQQNKYVLNSNEALKKIVVSNVYFKFQKYGATIFDVNNL